MQTANRKRFQAALRQAGVDLYIGVTSSNFRYLTGFNSSFIDLSWQMTGTDMVILPANEDLEPAIVISEYCEPEARAHSDVSDIRTYSMWTENRDLAAITKSDGMKITRPEQYDSADIFGIVRQIAEDRGLSDGVIGSDISLMKHGTFEAMRAAFPENELFDCEAIAYRVRSVKHPGEIQELRKAARLFDIGVKTAFDRAEAGQSVFELRSFFETAIQSASVSNVELGGLEKSFFFPHAGRAGNSLVAEGDVIKLDCGSRVNGYWSDGCRYACLGEPTVEQRLIHQALTSGYEAARETLRPGVRMIEVFERALNTVRANGLPHYSRGHFGHSIGLDDQTEEPPFLGPNNTLLEENMVICLEIPFYPPDVGGFNLEDMFLITADGAETLTTLDRGLREIG